MLNTEARQHLKTLLPYGLVTTKTWLQEQGLPRHFIDNAVKSRTLLMLAPGVYTRDESPLTWQGIVTSLQRMHPTPVTLGGLTALNLEGLAHYQLKGQVVPVSLYSSSPLPAWLNKITGRASFKGHSTRRLWPDSVMADKRFLRESQWQESLSPMLYSAPEKAMLELLSDVPKAISFEHADQIMQGLSTLSPRKLELLLQASGSIKSKRLFLWLAQRHNHAWFKYLKPDLYELGSGKREIAKSGRLDTTWNITVPKDM
ncbi:type IV toxin-antitoxin system AbiEi family antitoxin domain-containing protein [Rahnella sp. PAMC25617]|jgi:hypothetical protein|uniref:type IV toxin-antitoxin system AbiEi family antitoxin domain-containing protein n=1 Tax=Rahnella sp. PAMC25617 TaxID=3399684 RepID=UPI003D364828